MIKKVLFKMHMFLVTGGLDFYKFFHSMQNIPTFLKTAQKYKIRTERQFGLQFRYLYPILTDFYDQAGTASGHYFHQDLWAARKIFAAKPAKHVDIGSRVDGFIAHLLTFMPVEVIDIRPLDSQVHGLTFIQDDATVLARYDSNSLESLSSLHTIEHFGLGRYGDPVDPLACFKAMRAMARILKPGGRLYFSVPIGVERVEFNAHRVFAPQTVIETFKDLDLLSFAAVDDSGKFVSDATTDAYTHAWFACGLFEFTKTKPSLDDE